MTIIVADDQIYLAIGKKGQNVRLAAKLVKLKIDIQAQSGAHDDDAGAWMEESTREESPFPPASADGVDQETDGPCRPEGPAVHPGIDVLRIDHIFQRRFQICQKP